MSKTRWAVVLLMAIAALLAVLLGIIPRRPEGGSAPARESLPSGGNGRGGEAPYPVPEKEFEQPVEAQPEVRGGEPAVGPARLAIVIDDAGYSLSGLREFLRLPYPLAFSVLPGLPHSREAGRLVAAAGKELLLHLPMEPAGGANPGPGAVLTGHSDREIRQLLEENLELLPLAVGVNNHMGSRATADRRVMGVVLAFLRARGLYFLDSKTTPDSLGPEIAGELGVPLLERSVFLDNENSAAYIQQALERGVRVAEAQGRAVLIGHVQNVELAGELGRLLPGLESRGVQLVAPSALVAEEGSRP
jgi:hypothetical protein